MYSRGCRGVTRVCMASIVNPTAAETRPRLCGSLLKYSFFFKQKTAYEISACLVGSEMCIRDRLDDPPPQVHQLPENTAHNVRKV